jgi:hypothetical protein
MFYHIDLKALITDISSYMIWQRYWKIYLWQSEHECGNCITVFRHILAMLCEMFSVSWPMGRQRRTHCMASMLASFESSGFWPVGTPQSPCIYSSCWQWRDTSPLHCGCLSDYPQLPRYLWTVAAVNDMACRNYRGHFEHLLQMYPYRYYSQIKCFRINDNTDIFFLFCCVELVPKFLAHFSVHPIYERNFLLTSNNYKMSV